MSNVVTRTVTYLIDLCSCIYHSALNWKNSAMENVVITVAISVPQQNHLEFTQHLCDFPMAIPSGLFWDLNYCPGLHGNESSIISNLSLLHNGKA